MNLLDLIIKEYLTIVERLTDTQTIENNRIIIDKEYFRELLEKYGYIKFSEKAKVYKSLGLIIHDKNNYTLPCKDIELGKTVRKVVFNYDTYIIIKNLYETNIS